MPRPDLPAALRALTPAQQSLHNNFITSMAALRRDLVRAAYYLFQIRERRIHRFLGYSRIADCAAEAAGLNARQCRDFLNLARNLPDFPEVESALSAGLLTWSQARIICNKAMPEDQEKWIDAARSVSTVTLERKIEEAHMEQPPPEPLVPVRLESPGIPPREDLLPRPVATETWQHVTLKFTGDQYARWQGLAEGARRYGNLEESILEGLAGSGAKGTQETHIIILHCPKCDNAVFPTNRGEINVPRPLLKAGYCDGVIEDSTGSRHRAISPRHRRIALQRARYRCEGTGCGNASFLQIHHRTPVPGAGANDPENLMVLCWKCHRALHQSEETARRAIREAPS